MLQFGRVGDLSVARLCQLSHFCVGAMREPSIPTACPVLHRLPINSAEAMKHMPATYIIDRSGGKQSWTVSNQFGMCVTTRSLIIDALGCFSVNCEEVYLM